MLTKRNALALYSGLNLEERLYLRCRAALVRLSWLADLVQRRRRILDLACGFGLLGNHIACVMNGVEVVGIDHDPHRVDQANRAAMAGRLNATFRVGDIREASEGRFDAVLLIDSLHYFPSEERHHILAAARAALSPGGRFVLRQPVAGLGWRSGWVRVHESIMTASGWTKALLPKGLSFPDREGLRRELSAAGFNRAVLEPPPWWHPYPDVSAVCDL